MTQGYNARFGGVRRLFGTGGSERLRRAHVCVVGVGGVGSWAAEALARSGIGELTMVDFDDVCISNTDRQLHALRGTYGQPKVDVMSQRLRAINPDCQVQARRAFFTAATAAEILATQYDYLVDAIDRITAKCLLIAACRQHGIPIITAGAAGGRRDPTQVRVTDLTEASHDRLLQEVRRQLRRRHGFPRGQERFNVPCAYSPEPVVYAHPDGSVCAQLPADADLRLDCQRGYGTVAFVTGTLGFVAAAHVVAAIAAGR
jgi:tRNA threonylcarbamoyladenosine dehydratase